MKLSISNIAWNDDVDEKIYGWMKNYHFSGLEIAPTRIFPERPYDRAIEAATWAAKMKTQYGFTIASMQSIWFGRTERIFADQKERKILTEYTKKAIEFAEAVGCKNLVFGCPKNRNITKAEDADIAVGFFRELGEFAKKHDTVIGMEANPTIYNTNFVNDTKSAIDLIKEVNSDGFLLNLDLGTMVQNKEKIEELQGKVSLINHVHISEPWLKPIEKREMHKELKKLLEAEKYAGYISIEMEKVEDIDVLKEKMEYVRSIFE